MKKTWIVTPLILISFNALSAPEWVRAEVTNVFAGYPDNIIAFQTVEEVRNPAGCPSTGAYVVEDDHDTKSALAVLLTAKMNGNGIGFSVRDDVCHTMQQTDSSISVPVVQRIGIF